MFVVESEVDWVQCDVCNKWYHMFCVGLSKNQIKPDDDYVCRKCKKQVKPASPVGAATDISGNNAKNTTTNHTTINSNTTTSTTDNGTTKKPLHYEEDYPDDEGDDDTDDDAPRKGKSDANNSITVTSTNSKKQKA